MTMYQISIVRNADTHDGKYNSRVMMHCLLLRGMKTDLKLVFSFKLHLLPDVKVHFEFEFYFEFSLSDVSV